ncbi:hypothetical protein BDM02DRAFT_2476654 [Thelephora ganbajun]|uniref:Uncharacterized protein n=1 Tax=Thelephora ganbajun TaxID=370292 RepID=A0ACB6YYC9_THEGA|nr:hypothetical protein BDM02DRAFT_2476654 [Thelephora ganbajun]
MGCRRVRSLSPYGLTSTMISKNLRGWHGRLGVVWDPRILCQRSFQTMRVGRTGLQTFRGSTRRCSSVDDSLTIHPWKLPPTPRLRTIPLPPIDLWYDDGGAETSQVVGSITTSPLNSGRVCPMLVLVRTCPVVCRRPCVFPSVNAAGTSCDLGAGIVHMAYFSQRHKGVGPHYFRNCLASQRHLRPTYALIYFQYLHLMK